MNYLGIDPGANGGIVLLDHTGNVVWSHDLSKLTDSDCASIVSTASDKIRMCHIERVGAMPRQGVSSTFKFGHNTGLVTGIVLACKVAYELVSPQVWQKHFAVGKHDSKTEHKRALKAVAQRLFPDQKITNNTADAFLIAEYCRRINR
jgi:crossover junction endodeoxyribonuclease RuvC